MNARDLIQIGKISVLTAAAWATPPRYWRRAAAIIPHFGFTYPGPDLSVYRRILGPDFDDSALRHLNEGRRLCSRSAILQILGLKGTWRKWRPEIRLHGEKHLRNALDTGKGVILWVTESAYSTLVFKMAIHAAGYRVSHLTRPQHGFSTSPFGIKFLNPIWTRVEDRFIAERVTIQDDNSKRALEILRTRLATNGVVTISVGAAAHRLIEVPFFRHSIRLPTGPLRLAHDTGAALLPGFVIASNDGHFDVTIESPLPKCNEEDDFQRTATAYAGRLEPYVKNHPEQWTGWGFLFAGDKSILTR